MQIYSKKQFLIEDSYEITQFLRGELYILIDHCLSKVQYGSDSKIIWSFLDYYIEFFRNYIEVFHTNLKEVIQRKNQICV